MRQKSKQATRWTQSEKDFLKSLSVLIVGGGSMGKRHLRNLLDLGAGRVAVVEPLLQRQAEIHKRFGKAIGLFGTEREAYHPQAKYDVVIVANPTAFHLASAKRAVAHGAHVLIEKSLSHNRIGVAEFLKQAEKCKRVIGVSYVYRFSDSLKYVKSLIDHDKLGKIFSAQVTFSEYLPDWHPWENHQDFYMSHRRLGGGELLDENHGIDIARFLLGEVHTVSATVDRLARLTKDTDDFVEATLWHRNRSISQIHLDAFGRKPRKEFYLMGEKGFIHWDSYMGANQVEWYDGKRRQMKVYKGRMNRNDMFVDLLKNFLACVRHGHKPVVDGWEAWRILRISLAALDSHRSKRRIRIWR